MISACDLAPHDLYTTTLSFYCDVAVLARCPDQWEQIYFPSTVKTTEVSISGN